MCLFLCLFVITARTDSFLKLFIRKVFLHILIQAVLISLQCKNIICPFFFIFPLLQSVFPLHQSLRSGLLSGSYPTILESLRFHCFFFNSFLSKTKTILFTPRGYNVSCLSSSPFIGTHGFPSIQMIFQQLSIILI